MPAHHDQSTADLGRSRGSVVSWIEETERARDALFFLDASMPREEWVRVGMAAKNAGLAFDDFNEWSSAGSNYKGAKDCDVAWRSFDANGSVKAGTLFHIALNSGWRDEWKGRSSEAAPSALLTKMLAKTPLKKDREQGPPATTSTKAMQVWNHCVPATLDHQYVVAKAGTSEGVCVYPSHAPTLIINGQNVAGYLAVPCWSAGKLQTIQFVPSGDAIKLSLPGASFSDGYFTVGEIGATSTVYIVEGVGQAWACSAATGAPAVACFGAGRMATVASAVSVEFPNARLVIVPDRGKEREAARLAVELNCGWCEMPPDAPSNYDANDFARDKGKGELAMLLQAPKAAPMRYKVLSAGDLLAQPPMQWTVRGVLPQKGFGALYGPSGSGKSFLVLDIAAAVAGGAEDWFGHKITQCPVTYCALEGEGGIGKRIKAWKDHHGKGVPNEMRFVTQPFDLRKANDVADLAKAILVAGAAGGMVILDTLNRAAPGADENSSIDMGDLISASKSLQELIGGLVVLVHHTGKVESYGLRGHSSLYAALDGAIEVKCKENVRKWLVAKSKDDETGVEHVFNLNVVTVDVDDDGEDVTSCVVVPDITAAAIKNMSFPSGANQRAAFDVLAGPIRESADIGKGGAPEGKGCITFQAAMDIVASCMPGDAKHKRQRAKEAITALITKGTYGLGGDWIWTV